MASVSFRPPGFTHGCAWAAGAKIGAGITPCKKTSEESDHGLSFFRLHAASPRGTVFHAEPVIALALVIARPRGPAFKLRAIALPHARNFIDLLAFHSATFSHSLLSTARLIGEAAGTASPSSVHFALGHALVVRGPAFAAGRGIGFALVKDVMAFLRTNGMPVGSTCRHGPPPQRAGRAARRVGIAHSGEMTFAHPSRLHASSLSQQQLQQQSSSNSWPDRFPASESGRSTSSGFMAQSSFRSPPYRGHPRRMHRLARSPLRRAIARVQR
jgi:hypothetical protein